MEPIQSTAGAVAVLNEKGEVSMQKVKVHRYVSGKRPEYAPASSDEEESEDETFVENKKQKEPSPEVEDIQMMIPQILATDDPRIRRLISRKHIEEQSIDTDRRRSRRRVHETEVMEDDDSDKGEEDMRIDSSDEDLEDDLSDEEIQRRRQMIRERALLLKEQNEMEVLEREEDGIPSGDESASESSEYEEYSDSEEETGPRLKPVFVRKRDRLTIIEKEKEAARKKQLEAEMKKKAEERRRQTVKMVEEEIRKEQALKDNSSENATLNDVNTDDENDELEYEAWKLRELKRIKRDKEEREQMEKESMEIEHIRNMTEEERRQEFRLNPKQVTNKTVKGKYKFMQKYFHRGVFYMDEDDQLFKRNFAAATLDDHFDKTILPKVMQVKNFGRSGRTKYTHLVDQDTTHYDSPWVADTAQNMKFHNKLAAGTKQQFSRPSLRKHKQTN